MIYTVTFNPSLDYIAAVDGFASGKTNRCRDERIVTGGKGINVSIVLKNLGLDSVTLGFIAGFTGNEIERSLKEQGLECGFIRVKNGFSRINIKLKGEEESEINGTGPQISGEDCAILMDRLSQLCSGDYLVLAGSIPPSLPDTIYSDIMRKLEGKGVKVIADCSKALLTNLLEYKPFLIKPNSFELEETFGVSLGNNKDRIAHYARKLQDAGAENVLVSMAGDGAVLCAGNRQVYYSDAPVGEVRNSVGAGDSMVAGFIAGWIEKNDYVHAFKMGISAGSASAFSDGFCSRTEVEKIYTQLIVGS